MPQNTHTKILATIGPATSTKEQIEKLIDAGVDAFRINFSHGKQEEHKERIDFIRKLEKKKKIHVSILADLQGPKLRIGEFETESVQLKEGQEFELVLNDIKGNSERVTLPHKEIFQALQVGDELLLNDGNIRLKVLQATPTKAMTKVMVGGLLSAHKGVNLPNVTLPIRAITPKDEKDLKFALKCGVDWVCLSFVQKAEDVEYAKKLIKDKAWIITKIEKPSAIDDLDKILKITDAVMVARGDLGVECPLQKVPVLQKKIVSACRLHAKPVIVATQMLESMIKTPTPTRAEVSDVACAVYDGADTVMLSAETAVGKYPIEAVKMMRNIIYQVESDPLFYQFMHAGRLKHHSVSASDAITFAAGDISDVLAKVKAIVTLTSSGSTALLTARERPNEQIVAITQEESVARRLALVWGVKSVINKETFKHFDRVDTAVVKIVKNNGFAKSGDHIVITAGFPLGKKGGTNLLHTIKL